MPNEGEPRRRDLLTAAGVVPVIQPVLQPAGPAATSTSNAADFAPIDLNRFFTASATDFGPRPQMRFRAADGLIRTPGGPQRFRGIPFLLGSGEVQQKSWIALNTQSSAWTKAAVEIPVQAQARFVCLAQFCDWDDSELRPTGIDDFEKVGQLLAEVVLVYADGEKALPIRRRFETGSPSMPTGHKTFNSYPHAQLVPTLYSEGTGQQWGGNQTGVRDPAGPPLIWICALENPEPERPLKAIRLRAASASTMFVCGLTLFNGPQNPLRFGLLNVYRITLPPEDTADLASWKVSVDLGVVARTYVLGPFDGGAWLSAPDAGLGDRAPQPDPRYLYVEVTSNPSATLTLEHTPTGRRFAFPLNRSEAGRIELLEPRRAWIHCRIVDGATRRPTPSRLAFRSALGRYIPPAGHRIDINTGWFQDYGADLKLRDSSFAYVDGTFQVDLPVGEVYVEVSKGFEYEPVRQRLNIQPGQRELELTLPRFASLRDAGWVTADTHVHFLSPSTAILQAQAEGLNLVNLLAAQWGNLYTNVGDLPHGPVVSADRETIVWPGTENRSNVMGHTGLLGGHGEPVFPLSASAPQGPDDAYFGEPLRMSMADWTDACRDRGGLAIAVHFPYPPGELAADIVLGKIDAVEVVLRGEQFNTLRVLDWYRCLNCGYRLPAVGGTDKMSASTAVGAVRTYVQIGRDEFSFESWSKAVRSGHTFTTTGPLLFFHADGRQPGGDITMTGGGGTVEVVAEARSNVPLLRVEIVCNGHVVASREAPQGARELTLREHVKLTGPGWVAARCASRHGTAAHTSPVYLRVPGSEAFSMPAAAYLLTLIEGTQCWVENMVTRPDPAALARIKGILAEAHMRLQQRIRSH